MTKNIYAKLNAKIGSENKKLKEQADNRGQQFEKLEYFKPKTGDNMIRLLPNLEEIEKTWVVVKVHFLPTLTKDGKEVNVPVRCLADYEEAEKCPACKEYKRLMDEGDKEAAKQFRVKEQFLYNVLDYTGKKVMPYAMPSKAHETIMSFLEDLGGAAFDMEEGRDWKLTKKVDPSKGRIFGTEYQIKPVMKESAVPEKFSADIEAAKPLTEIYPESDLAATKKRMLKLLELDEEEEEEEAPKKKAPAGGKATPAKNKYEDDEDEDESYAKKPLAKKKVVEEEEDEEDYTPKKKKAKVEVEEDLEDEINKMLEDDDE
jgi:hypothetical protein